MTRQAAASGTGGAVREQVARRRGIPGPPPPWHRTGGLDSLFLLPGADTPRPSASVSVVIPAWNSEGTIAACLAGLARAAQRVAGRVPVEVIVVDDGSRAEISGYVPPFTFAVDIHLVRVGHRGQSRASNTGAARAAGDILVFCDSDMVLNPWSIDSLVTGLDQWPDALCFGFRESARPGAPVPLLPSGDNRFRFDLPGTPTSMFAATRNLEDLTSGRRLAPPGRTRWHLARMVYGCLLACRRREFLELGGFDGRFVRWGYNDTELAARWIASGRPVVPVFTAGGLHIDHAPRHPLQWRMAGQSAALYERSLGEGWRRDDLATAPVEEVRHVPGRGAGADPGEPRIHSRDVARAAAGLGDLILFERACGEQVADAVRDPRLARDALRALRLSGAEQYFDHDPVPAGPPDLMFEVGLLAAACGDTGRARAALADAAKAANWLTGGTARQLLRQPPARPLRLARTHARLGIARAAATGALAAALADGTGRFREPVRAVLEDIPLTDRRVY